MKKFMSKLKLYIENWLVALDQLANVAIGGSPDETMSSRAAKRREDCILCAGLCWLLGLIDRNHCDRYIEPDEGDRDVIK